MFVAFNNRNATDVIPLMAPLIAPSARLLGPILNQIAASPVRSTVEVSSLMGVLTGLVVGLHKRLVMFDHVLNALNGRNPSIDLPEI